MSNITIYQNQFITAYQSKRISEFDKREAQKEIRKIISLTFQRKGQIVEDKDLGFFSADLLRIILNDFKFLRIDELRTALEKGVLGEYGEYFGLNTVTYCNWIKSYLSQEERGKEIMKLNQPKHKEKEPSNAEKLEGMKNYIRRIFGIHKNLKQCNDSFNLGYNFLNRYGLIPHTADERNAILDLAKEQIGEELKLQLQESRSLERNEKKAQLEDFLNGNSDKAISRAKLITLNDFFRIVGTAEELEKKLELITEYKEDLRK